MASTGKKYRVGCHLIVFGKRPAEDLDGVLAEIAAAGFEGVEGGNLYAAYGQDRVRALLDRHGLAVSAAHSGYADTSDAGKVEAALGFLRETGARYLINSGVGEGEGLAPYERAAEVFNRVGRRCQEAGITFCYHNHDWEFRRTADGAVPFERLAALTDPAVVKLNMDVYWVTFAGQDVGRFIATYGARIPYVHLKDLKGGTFTELGTGTIDFPAILAALGASAPVEWLIYEQDRTTLPTAEAVGISGRYLRQTLGL
jgi:sugar phosphate isomerase/epimerase